MDVDVDLDPLETYPPYTGWEPGTRYAGSLSNHTTFDSQNQNNWGTTIDYNLPINSLGFVIRIEGTADPDVRRVLVESFSMVVPSFVHDKTSPNKTGTNRYRLRTSFANVGNVNVNSGQIELVKLHSLLTNSYYSAADPVKVLMDVTGELDVANETGSLSVTTVAYEDPEE